MRWPDNDIPYEPRIRRTVSDIDNKEWMSGFLWGIALTLVAAFLLGAMALLWLGIK